MNLFSILIKNKKTPRTAAQMFCMYKDGSEMGFLFESNTCLDSGQGVKSIFSIRYLFLLCLGE